MKEFLETKLNGRSITLLALSLCGLFFWIGYPVWRCTLSTDAFYEVADGFAIQKGRILYHEFIPTYGFLYPLLLNFILYTKHFAFTIITALGLIWIITQSLQFPSFLKSKSLWSVVGFSLLFIGHTAFHHSEGNFVTGFSQSSVISATLMLVGITNIIKKPSTHSFVGFAIVAGIIPYIKEDFAITSISLLIFLILFVAPKNIKLKMLAAFLATWLGILGLLLLQGSEWHLLYWSALDFPLSSDKWSSDMNLRRRVGLVIGIVLIVMIMSRFCVRKTLIRHLSKWLWIMFPITIAFDFFRHLQSSSIHIPAFRWMIFAICIYIGFDLIIRFYRKGLAFFKRRSVLMICLPLAIGAFGYLRVFKSGWYPFAMSEPFALIIFWQWLIHPLENLQKTTLPRISVLLTSFAIALSTLCSLSNPNPFIRLETRLGWLGLPTDLAHRVPVLEKAEALKDSSGVFGSDPLLGIALDIPPLNIHSGLMRLQVSLPTQEMEERTLQILKNKNPRLIYLENLTNPTRKLFGHDHAVGIWNWIKENYEPTYHAHGGFDPQSRQPGSTLFVLKVDKNN